MADEFSPVAPFDLSDDKLVAGELRALRTEMRSWFEILINRLERYDERIAVLEVHRSDANERLSRHDRRLAALEAAAATKKET
jgi:hypothetical protein